MARQTDSDFYPLGGKKTRGGGGVARWQKRRVIVASGTLEIFVYVH